MTDQTYRERFDRTVPWPRRAAVQPSDAATFDVYISKKVIGKERTGVARNVGSSERLKYFTLSRDR